MAPLQISDAPEAVDLDAVHRFLAEQSTWARGIPRAVVERAVANSLCFSARDAGRFVGFAPLARPEIWMERFDPSVYQRQTPPA